MKIAHYKHLALIGRISGTEFIPSRKRQRLNRIEAELQQKLIRDCWPWVGARCISFTLADGSKYTPALVTCDEGVVVVWDAVTVDTSGQCPMFRGAALLPKDKRLMFVTCHRIKGGWIEEDMTPRFILSDIPRQIVVRRAVIERLAGRCMSDHDLRYYWADVEEHMAARVAAARARVA